MTYNQHLANVDMGPLEIAFTSSSQQPLVVVVPCTGDHQQLLTALQQFSRVERGAIRAHCEDILATIHEAEGGV